MDDTTIVYFSYNAPNTHLAYIKHIGYTHDIHIAYSSAMCIFTAQTVY